MTTQTKHTPLWKYHGSPSVGFTIRAILPDGSDSYALAKAFDEEQAAFICQAVNSHYQLAEALRAMLKLSISHPVHPEFRVKCQEQAAAALALAEKGSL